LSWKLLYPSVYNSKQLIFHQIFSLKPTYHLAIRISNCQIAMETSIPSVVHSKQINFRQICISEPYPIICIIIPNCQIGHGNYDNPSLVQPQANYFPPNMHHWKPTFIYYYNLKLSKLPWKPRYPALYIQQINFRQMCSQWNIPIICIIISNWLNYHGKTHDNPSFCQ